MQGITYLFCMSDRVLGYWVILFLTVFLLVPLIYFAAKFLAPVHHRTIVFENLNTLSFLHIQDPVRVLGIEAGMVRSISWKDGKTYVEIETRDELTIRKGYRVVAEDKGFMGDRFVAIYPGNDSSAPIIARNTLLRGEFLMGPTEAIAYMDRLKTIADSAAAIAVSLRSGSSGKRSLAAKFGEAVKSLDSATLLLSRVFRKAGLLSGKTMDTLAEIMESTRTMVDRFSTSVPRTVTTVESLIAKTGRLLADADTLIASSSDFAGRMNSRGYEEINETFRKLKARLSMLRDAVNELQNDGARVRMRIW